MRNIAKTITASRKRMLVSVIILLVVVFGVYKFFFAGSGSQNQVQTQTVQRGTIVSTVSGSGTISSANSIQVTTSTSGLVADVYVKNGDTVKAGQKIATIKPDQASLQRQASAYANYLSSVNQLKTAQDNKLAADATMWTDQKSVLDTQNSVDYKNNNTTNPSTKKDYTDLEKQSIESASVQAQKAFKASEQKYKDADAAIAADQADVNSSFLSYQQSQNTITAPIDGTINGLTLLKGMTLASTGNSNSNSTGTSTGSTGGTGSNSSSNTSSSSQKVAVVQTSAIPAVTINASEVDATKIKQNQKATITLDAIPNKTFTGHVASIDTTGSVSSGVTTYPVIVMFDSEAANIYPNMAATANIIIETKDDVLTVPTSAIQTQNGVSTVRVMKNGQIQPVQVETGISSDSDTEITSGLSEGDVVVASLATSTGATRSGSASPFGASPFGGRIGGGFGGGGGGVRRGN